MIYTIGELKRILENYSDDTAVIVAGRRPSLRLTRKDGLHLGSGDIFFPSLFKGTSTKQDENGCMAFYWEMDKNQYPFYLKVLVPILDRKNKKKR